MHTDRPILISVAHRVAGKKSAEHVWSRKASRACFDALNSMRGDLIWPTPRAVLMNEDGHSMTTAKRRAVAAMIPQPLAVVEIHWNASRNPKYTGTYALFDSDHDHSGALAAACCVAAANAGAPGPHGGSKYRGALAMPTPACQYDELDMVTREMSKSYGLPILKPPSVLVEVGFHTNADSQVWFERPDSALRYGQELARAIVRWRDDLIEGICA